MTLDVIRFFVGKFWVILLRKMRLSVRESRGVLPLKAPGSKLPAVMRLTKKSLPVIRLPFTARHIA